jgi:hypothetical protein
VEQACELLTLAQHNSTKKNATYLQGELFHSAFHSLGGCQLRGAHINFAHTPTTPLGGGTQGSFLLVTEGPHLCMLRKEGLKWEKNGATQMQKRNDFKQLVRALLLEPQYLTLSSFDVDFKFVWVQKQVGNGMMMKAKQLRVWQPKAHTEVHAALNRSHLPMELQVAASTSLCSHLLLLLGVLNQLSGVSKDLQVTVWTSLPTKVHKVFKVKLSITFRIRAVPQRQRASLGNERYL